MNSIKTLLERFRSETPLFFKRLDLIGLALVAVAGFLADNGISGKIITVTGAIGAVLCLVAKFAKTDIAQLESSSDPAKTIIDNLPQYQDQLQQVIDGIKPILRVVHRAPELSEFPEPKAELSEFPESPADKPQNL